MVILSLRGFQGFVEERASLKAALQQEGRSSSRYENQSEFYSLTQCNHSREIVLGVREKGGGKKRN